MLYAAAEIIFWILLAAVIGGGIGFGLAQAKLVALNKRLSQSRADAPMERELAIAWDTIEDLNKRLQVAHETIREINGDASYGGEDAAAADPDGAEDDGELNEEELDAIVAEKMAQAGKSDSGVVGSRLSERVSSASRARNEFSDGLEG